jgi:multiple sugar transport system ATP-binding protein
MGCGATSSSSTKPGGFVAVWLRSGKMTWRAYIVGMATVTLEAIDKVYENGFHAVHGLDLAIADKEFLVLVGPSGCGKSTVLRMIAGLESITAGKLLIGDTVMNDVEPKDRDIAMIFQNYALYPHMTVYDNIAFALKLARVPKPEIDRRVRKVASTIDHEQYLDRKPAQLSGGQRQRVAMGRAIVRQPSVFLMDEPLSNLDAKLRVQMRAEIARLQRDLGVTTVYVTHDQVEAMTMGDRVAVLKDGYLQQLDTPRNLYASPDNVFVAAFIGSPSMNLYEGRLEVDGESPTVLLGSQRVALDSDVFARRPGLRRYVGRAVVVGIRPEDLEDAAVAIGAPPERRITATVRLVESLGAELMVHIETDATTVDSGDPDAPEQITAPSVANGVARFSPHSQVEVDDDIEIVVAVETLHFFDSESHEAIRQ